MRDSALRLPLKVEEARLVGGKKKNGPKAGCLHGR